MAKETLGNNSNKNNINIKQVSAILFDWSQYKIVGWVMDGPCQFWLVYLQIYCTK